MFTNDRAFGRQFKIILLHTKVTAVLTEKSVENRFEKPAKPMVMLKINLYFYILRKDYKYIDEEMWFNWFVT